MNIHTRSGPLFHLEDHAGATLDFAVHQGQGDDVAFLWATAKDGRFVGVGITAADLERFRAFLQSTEDKGQNDA